MQRAVSILPTDRKEVVRDWVAERSSYTEIADKRDIPLDR